ncbi:MAG: peptide chain release factor 1 [Candidatus Solincola sediminis]|uniref:Peptide chain release factor 1 n=1 Tax=Candidatus Solincola sediminis TaxID=1797199 RepID=A0A1F2WFD2_9ACTN|nr:MAG: peptide chain release factor 1 [Candidatus Solincola sediminis]OFW57881.1 MAG: peptide chain release factor 1 [Candidatus Solincola sediminis]
MMDRLNQIESTFLDLERQLSEPEVYQDRQRYRELTRSHSELAEVVSVLREYRAAVAEAQEARDLMKEESEPEMADFLRDSLQDAEARIEDLEERLRMLLIPADSRDEKDVIMEIRAGAGGNEASLFGGDLFRMYDRYADRNGWKLEILSSSPSDLGGFKEIIFALHGKGAYSKLKYESGVHRVQRIPVTESGGRIHTSTATVAVLPEAEEVEVKIEPSDLRVDVFRSTGPGGQSVNTTDSAVRMTHVPTGVTVSCQDEKSQLQNREKALRILRARLLRVEQERQQKEQAEERRLQVGTGDRSERIRTYNYPQGRISDHRIGLTTYRLDEVLDGDLEEIIEALAVADRAEKLKELARGE